MVIAAVPLSSPYGPLVAALRDIKPGETVVYHHGCHLNDIEHPCPIAIQQTVSALRREGKVILLQKRVKPPVMENGDTHYRLGRGAFDFLAIGRG